MAFQVPAEYADFVSSADSLLREFGNDEKSDYVVCNVYAKTTENAEVYARKLSASIAPLIAGYIWHEELFRMVHVSSSGIKIPGILHFRSELKTGGNVEDEWFLVYLWLTLTKQYSEISVGINDNDGEFLLIEAADELPDWVGPENSRNRVWLRHGHVILISPEDVLTSRVVGDGITLSSALAWLLGNVVPQKAIAARVLLPKVQRCIEKRSTLCYPAKVAVTQHRAMCILPRVAAEVLVRYPQAVSFAARSILNSDSSSKKNFAAMNLLSGKLQPANAASLASEGASISTKSSWLNDLVLVPILFSRALYAHLTYKKFSSPKIFHSAWKRVGSCLQAVNDGLASGPGSKLRTAFELGSKLTCGLEAAYHHNAKLRKSRAGKISSRESDLVSIVESIHCDDWDSWIQQQGDFVYVRSSDQGSCKRIPIEPLDVAMDRVIASYSRRGEAIEGAESCPNIVEIDTANGIGRQEVIARLLVGGDSEDWLFLSPSELDEEINRKIGDIGQASESSVRIDAEETIPSLVNIASTTAADTINQATAAQQMDQMLTAVKTFMGSKSGLEGVEHSSKYVPPDPPNDNMLSTEYTPQNAEAKPLEDRLSIGYGEAPKALPTAVLEHFVNSIVNGNSASLQGEIMNAITASLSNCHVSTQSSSAGATLNLESTNLSGEGESLPCSAMRDQLSATSSAAKSSEVDNLDQYFYEEDLNGWSDNSSVSSDDIRSDDSHSDEGRVDQPVALGTTKGSGSFFLRSMCDQGPVLDDDESGRDSDDQSTSEIDENKELWEGGTNNETNDEFFEQYSSAMDHELGLSTLSKSFERFQQNFQRNDTQAEHENYGGVDSDLVDDSDDAKCVKSEVDDDDDQLGIGDVDVDLNLIKYFLQSHASQLGGPGPASALLSQLGIQLPDAPSPSVEQKPVRK